MSDVAAASGPDAVAGLAGFRAWCAGLNPAAVPESELPRLWADLVEMGRLVDGAKTRVVGRVADRGQWRRDGYRSAAAWLAREQGSSVAAAREALDTSARLAEQPVLDDALAAGKVSAPQAAAVSDAASADPCAESRLTDAAQQTSLRDLRDSCDRTKRAADPDPAATAAKAHANRRCRTRHDGDGGFHLSLFVPSARGAAIEAALRPVVDKYFQRARRAGEREPVEAYAADAVTDILTGATDTRPSALGRRRRPDTKIIALIAHSALARGSVQPGETCEIAGIGPVPYADIERLRADAFLAAVVTDGVDIVAVAHAGHEVTAHQRTVMEARGYHCERPGCDQTRHLEIHHTNGGFTTTRRTRIDELAWVCPHDHDLITYRAHHLRGPPGHRQWITPDSDTHGPEPPPPQPASRGAPGTPAAQDHPDQTELFGSDAAKPNAA